MSIRFLTHAHYRIMLACSIVENASFNLYWQCFVGLGEVELWHCVYNNIRISDWTEL